MGLGQLDATVNGGYVLRMPFRLQESSAHGAIATRPLDRSCASASEFWSLDSDRPESGRRVNDAVPHRPFCHSMRRNAGYCDSETEVPCSRAQPW